MVKKNGVYLIDITGMTHEGQGVGRVNELVVFVEGTLKGETVEAKVIKLYKRYAIGKPLKHTIKSPDRTEPFCGVYNQCGGCNLQHMNYQAQLKFKTDLVKETLKKIGGIDAVEVHDTLGMKDPYAYRNKAQFPVTCVNGLPAAGFYAKGTHDVIVNMECGIQDESSNKIKEIIIDFITEKGLSIYDEQTGRGLVRHIVTRKGYKTGEIMVILVINGDGIPMVGNLIKNLIENIEGVKSIILNINRKDTNVILGDKFRTIYGRDHITDYIGKYKFRISPLSFFQVNPVQTEVLYNKVLEYADLKGNETVFDVYCGIGTIAIILSEKAGKVIGVESVRDAVRDARKNAELNNVKNVEFIAGDAEMVIEKLYRQEIKADVVVLDPPRKGCETTLLKTLSGMQPDRIIYVSCNPATLARDLKFLGTNGGYRVLEVQPVDMFPWTGHVETVVLMSRVEK